MEIILLETVGKLGNLGDQTRVRGGYARNYLFPRKLALPVNKQNIQWLEQHREELEKKQAERGHEADQLATKVAETVIEISASCGPEGQLHGSVSAADIVNAASEKELTLSKRMVKMPEERITSVGEHQITIKVAADTETVLRLTVTPATQS